MPRGTVRKALIVKQKEMGIRRHIGQIILDKQKCNMRDYQEVKNHLMKIYSVNSTNVECRLKDIGILIDRRNIDVQHISELFNTE
jgi:hypothetical protein